MNPYVLGLLPLLLVASCGAGQRSPRGVGGGAGAAGSGGARAAGAAGSGAGEGGAGRVRETRVLVFSRTLGFRHASIADGIAALQTLGTARGWQVTATEAAETFNDGTLAQFDVVVFLSTSGDVLDAAQRAAMQRFIQQGRGFVGIHSATDTGTDWPWYGQLVGAYFRAHPAIQTASVLVEDAGHPATAGLSSPWVRTDEWYAFKANPRAEVRVLLRLDEASYAPDASGMGADHPLAWCHEFDGGRAFYTALGHTEASYSEPAFLEHLAGGVEWAAGVDAR